MPKWVDAASLSNYVDCYEEDLYEQTHYSADRELTQAEQRIAQERYTMIAGVLPFIGEERKRSQMIDFLAAHQSKQTIRKYLCLYLVYQDTAALADKYGVCVLLVHHTRKQQAGDHFEMISGTTGLLGCADGAFLMQKEKRTDLSATLDIVGRDQPDQNLHLIRDAEKLIWQLDHAETDLWQKPPDQLLEKISTMITEDKPILWWKQQRPTALSHTNT